MTAVGRSDGRASTERASEVLTVSGLKLTDRRLRSIWPSARGRSSDLPGSRARGRRSSSGRSPASTRRHGRGGRRRLRGGPVRSTPRGPLSAPGWPTSPATASGKGCSPISPCSRTSAFLATDARRGPGSLIAEGAPHVRRAGRALDPARTPRRFDQLAERRQPAEGRDRPLAGRVPSRARPERSDPRRRHRHEATISTTC